MKFKNFINIISDSDRIFSSEDIENMSTNEFSKNEKAIRYQWGKTGIPTNSELANSSNTIFVKEYTKDDGTKVKSHYRSKPDNSISNNLVNEKQHSLLDKNKNLSQRQDILIKFNSSKNKDRPLAKELMDISIIEPENLAEKDYFKVLDKNETETINKLFNLKESGLKIDKNWSGIRFKETSELSKELSNSPQLQKQIKQHCAKKKNFTTDDKFIGLELYEDKNLHYSIGHCTILNPHIDDKGYFTGFVFDKYDFDMIFDYKNNYDLTFVNNSAAIGQKFNKLAKYYILAPIKFKMND